MELTVILCSFENCVNYKDGQCRKKAITMGGVWHKSEQIPVCKSYIDKDDEETTDFSKEGRNENNA